MEIRDIRFIRDITDIREIRDTIYTELGNLSTTEIENLMNTINSDIRRVTTQKEKDNVSPRIKNLAINERKNKFMVS